MKSAQETVRIYFKLERTRGAGAPEALGTETVDEDFRLRRNVPLIWRLRRQDTVWSRAESFAQLFQKSRYFLGPGKWFLLWVH